MKSKLIYLAVFFVIIIFANFLKEVAFFINESLSYFVRSLYVLPWVALVILIVFYLVKKINGIKPWEFLGYSVLAGMLFSIIGLTINITLELNNSLEKNYVGVYGIITGFNPNTDSEVVIDHKTNVYRITDNRAKRELRRLENKYEDSYKHEFMFWQTAFATGFEPKYIFEYKGTDSFSKVLTLFFTIGPIFLLETFINTIMDSWILFLIPIIGLFFKKKIFEEQLKPIIKHFTNRTKKTA